MPIFSAATTSAAMHAAAAKRRRMQQEEEEMTPYGSSDVERYEFKIIRSATGMFKHPEKLHAVLAEEARAGWELVEKFDNGRIRLKRDIQWREKDARLPQDAYRITVGIGEGGLVLIILAAVFGAIGLIITIAAIAAAS
jgi:hypothetical protein